MNRLAGAIVLALILSACIGTTSDRPSDMQPDPSAPEELLDCESHERLALSGSDFEALSTAPKPGSFVASGASGQRTVATTKRFSESVWIGHDPDGEVVGVLTLTEQSDDLYKLHELLFCTSN